MATLVLSTVGSSLGGPIGGAIGALIGQSIDQQLLGSPRRGPRLGDLSVQSSSYGTQIPRVYGSMRVAGSIVWSTDLVESDQTAGAKGQPDVTYSYSVSFAVALSSRPAAAIGRIWADGKLLRGAAGDFKTDVTFRFYDGSEDQPVDPLIGSIEGIGNTPAYRGLALAVFENLQLADFGNRIPFLTFELFADDGAVSVGSIFTDASRELINSDSPQQLVGFAAYGSSIKSALEPLVECFGVELFDDGMLLRSGTSIAPVAIEASELGNSADSRKAVRVHREQSPLSAVPAALRLSYYDPARDYQTGEARAVAGEQGGNEVQQQLPAVLAATEAKSLAHAMLARAWLERDRLTLRLAPSQLGLPPGTQVQLPFSPSAWIVDKITMDGFVPVAECRPFGEQDCTVAADSGRIVANADVVAGPLSIALLDIPNVFAPGTDDPTMWLAASTATAGWRSASVEIEFGGQNFMAETARGKSVLGSASTALGIGASDLIDDVNSVDVVLVDVSQWLTSCDDDGLAAGENLAVLGNELIQFGRATSLGNGHFRLSHLLRGRGGTEWACSAHVPAETFCLVRSGTLESVTMPASIIGAAVNAQTGGIETGITFAAESVRPLSPVNLSASRQPNGDLLLKWTRRSRQGFAWLDEVDAPLGESSEQYRVDISGTADSIELTSAQPTLTVPAADLVALGPGSATIEVRQIGDMAASRPAQLQIEI